MLAGYGCPCGRGLLSTKSHDFSDNVYVPLIVEIDTLRCLDSRPKLHLPKNSKLDVGRPRNYSWLSNNDSDYVLVCVCSSFSAFER
jgi:hypothetical protein